MSEQAHVQSFTNKSFAEHVAVGEREEACASYCALQESAAVQLLLDVCLTQQQDKVKGWGWRVGLCMQTVGLSVCPATAAVPAVWPPTEWPA